MSGEYQAKKWQIVKDDLGYEEICETNEDGGPGDLVAEVYGDHAALIAAAPDLFAIVDELYKYALSGVTYALPLGSVTKMGAALAKATSTPSHEQEVM